MNRDATKVQPRCNYPCRKTERIGKSVLEGIIGRVSWNQDAELTPKNRVFKIFVNACFKCFTYFLVPLVPKGYRI